MEYIAYNTSLDIKTLVQNKQQARTQHLEQKAADFIENKKRLLPYVLKYLHYLTDLHNSVVINSCFAGGDYRRNVRIMSINPDKGKLELAKVIEEYAADFHFGDNGASYQCNLFKPIIREGLKIWLHVPGKFEYRRDMEYTCHGNGKYYNSIEEWTEELTECWINSERNKS